MKQGSFLLPLTMIVSSPKSGTHPKKSSLFSAKHQFLQPFLVSHDLKASPPLKPSMAPLGQLQFQFLSLAFKALQCMLNLNSIIFYHSSMNSAAKHV